MCADRARRVRAGEQQRVVAERVRHAQRHDQHRRHRGEHREPHRALLGVDDARQPGVADPRPPQHRRARAGPSPSPAHVGSRAISAVHWVMREHEHEVEEQLERRDPLDVTAQDRRQVRSLAFRLGHGAHLAMPSQARETRRPREVVPPRAVLRCFVIRLARVEQRADLAPASGRRPRATGSRAPPTTAASPRRRAARRGTRSRRRALPQPSGARRGGASFGSGCRLGSGDGLRARPSLHLAGLAGDTVVPGLHGAGALARLGGDLLERGLAALASAHQLDRAHVRALGRAPVIACCRLPGSGLSCHMSTLPSSVDRAECTGGCHTTPQGVLRLPICPDCCAQSRRKVGLRLEHREREFGTRLHGVTGVIGISRVDGAVTDQHRVPELVVPQTPKGQMAEHCACPTHIERSIATFISRHRPRRRSAAPA